MQAASEEVVASEQVASRQEQRQSPLYKGRVEVYAKAIKGRFRTIKWWALVVLLGVYYLAPWIRWQRPGDVPDQAILVDMAGRRLYFFWIEIWPQEVYYLTGILVLAAFGLFLATALLGRVWCGFTCPQTVWTDLFMAVERRIEGDRNQRMRFDRKPWTSDKILKKTLKHAIWLLIALATGGAWIMYFNDAPTVIVDFFTGEAGAAVYFFAGLFTTTTYLLAGHAREQVCTYMCPWPRIQGALIDEDTLAVTYERWRGEPRGKHKKGQSWEGRGDCVDCRQCVAVCPMGIDIRDGFQMECIGCGLCIDACNDVMAKVDRPLNLITYDSERNQERRAEGAAPVYRFVRPRTLLYAGILVLVAAIMVGTLAMRRASDVSIIPQRNPLFVTLADGSIRNGYTLRLINKAHEPRRFELALGDAALTPTFSVPGRGDGARSVVLEAPADGVGSHRVYLTLPEDEVAGASMPVELVLRDPAGDLTMRHETVFRGPEE